MYNLTVQRLAVTLLLIAFVASAVLAVQAFTVTRAVKADACMDKEEWHCNACGWCKEWHVKKYCEPLTGPDACTQCYPYWSECYLEFACCSGP